MCGGGNQRINADGEHRATPAAEIQQPEFMAGDARALSRKPPLQQTAATAPTVRGLTRRAICRPRRPRAPGHDGYIEHPDHLLQRPIVGRGATTPCTLVRAGVEDAPGVDRTDAEGWRRRPAEPAGWKPGAQRFAPWPKTQTPGGEGGIVDGSASAYEHPVPHCYFASTYQYPSGFGAASRRARAFDVVGVEIRRPPLSLDRQTVGHSKKGSYLIRHPMRSRQCSRIRRRTSTLSTSLLGHA